MTHRPHPACRTAKAWEQRTVDNARMDHYIAPIHCPRHAGAPSTEKPG